MTPHPTTGHPVTLRPRTGAPAPRVLTLSHPPPLETLLHGLACLAAVLGMALAPAARADAAEAVVVASTAPGYTAGQVVPDGGAIRLPEGAGALFLFASGRTLRIQGPYEGALEAAPEPRAGGGFGGLAGGDRFFQGDIGGTRALPNGLGRTDGRAAAVDLAVPGTHCLGTSGTPSLRPSREPAAAVFRDPAGGIERRVAWSGGEETIPWPKDVPVRDGVEAVVTGADGRPGHSLRFRLVEEAASGATFTVRLAAAGCRTQAAALLAPLSRTMVPLDIYLSTSRGPHPVYRRGDAIQLVMQTNRDAHVYCYLRNTRGELVPIFPPKATASSLVKAHTTLSIPDDDGAAPPLHAGDRAADLDVRCFAADRDLGSELPGRGEPFRPLSADTAMRVEQTLNARRSGDLAMAQVVVRVD